MQITPTGVAIGAAVVIALAFLFFGPYILAPFSSSPATTATTMTDDQNATPSAEASSTAPTDLEINDLTVGTGTEAMAGDTVTVNYVGALQDGTVFDASASHPETQNGFTFTLGAGQVIQGWDQGIAGMKVGGTRVLVIPASLGYGDQAVGPIPANSTLIFEVQLLNVQKGSAQ